MSHVVQQKSESSAVFFPQLTTQECQTLNRLITPLLLLLWPIVPSAEVN
jgi:hypothetical protein